MYYLMHTDVSFGLPHYRSPMHSPFTACLSQKEDNSVVVDGGAVVEFFCLSISYGYCLGLGVNAYMMGCIFVFVFQRHKSKCYFP